MDSTVITTVSNSLIILTGSIMNFIFDNPIAGWILLGLFGFACVIGIILYKKCKKISNMTREEAINEIKSWAIPSKKGREVLETLIPELAENEDERIRKALIDEIKVWDEDYKLFKHVSKEKVLAYLEKMKEHSMSAKEVLARAGLKPYKDGNQWCILAGDNIQDGICGFGDTIDEALYQFLMEVLEMQKEQKPADDEAKAIAYREYERGRESGLRDGQKYVLDNAESYGLCKPAEWSEEDEKLRQSIIKDIEWDINYNVTTAGKVTEKYNEQINWLKALPERFNLQPKQEWSEEDEKIMQTMIKEGDLKPSEIAWLKSLRPSWKPSEEQMKALEKVRTIFHHYHLWDEINPILYDYEELMRDLQKL